MKLNNYLLILLITFLGNAHIFSMKKNVTITNGLNKRVSFLVSSRVRSPNQEFVYAYTKLEKSEPTKYLISQAEYTVEPGKSQILHGFLWGNRVGIEFLNEKNKKKTSISMAEAKNYVLSSDHSTGWVIIQDK